MPSANEIQQGLVGTWKLISLISKPVNSDGPIGYPLGKDAQGYLFYSAQGYMAATLMSPGAKEYTTTDPYNASDDEAGEAARNFMSYSGPFEVFFQDGQSFVKHHTDVSLVPNWAGKHQIRQVDLNGDELVLSPDRPWELNGILVNQYLTWKRL
ncbi:hypothetical protein N7456_011315 [Penicillium angulare]|uniref:Lipocalin-like domain-containing protein n=1 Tax=Penicillium angulare TaxID=116970 RepID=A0A9W9ETN9_9EURO|nr:hypothetical protein N7456_011315 [Penicillium angulare]